MPYYVEIVDISDYLYEDDLECLEREIDGIVKRLTKDECFGSIDLDLGSTHLTLNGNRSYLDELRCKIYPAHASKRGRYLDEYVVKHSRIVCQLVTGIGGKELWVEISDDPYPIIKNKWNSEMRFSTLDEANAYIQRKGLLQKEEINALLRKFWNFLQEYATKRDCSVTLTCDGGMAEKAITILGNSCPWYSQSEENIIQRLQM